MGVGIILIVAGVLVGGVMAAAPRGIWWATQSWKFRNPEANEPSDLSYGMTRASGVVLICVALVMGSVLISDDLSKSAREKREREAEAQQQAAEAAFVVPPPENRGQLPVVGYFAEEYPRGVEFEVFYIAPERSVQHYVRMSSERFSFPCYTSATVTRGDGGRVTVNAELIWAPTKLGDMDESDDCRLGRRHEIHSADVDQVTATTPILTDSSIVNLNGTEIASATTGNAVPKLTEEPDANGTRATVSDRGVLPIVGYGINDDYLDISYLRPRHSGARAGRLDEWPEDGCEIDPIITGLDTGTVTVNLRLRWANVYGYFDDEDDKKCVMGDGWSGVMTSRWNKVTGAPVVLTDGPIVDADGKVLIPAAPGNLVPER
ncbi:DUF6199 family natural product biosynthesis protein [Mycolicibacterium sp. 050232]|uniref:DUF6199 family natural product biosynthesis protein n=1 Tax=Mycolicibacterium sp. 050232 TaxID=3113982 RepID=UPI002E2900F8|nr:DUF6199 family natural product biosynthesis protein [Mycolicibacterium sp. 050232]MED5812407.1 DUF6199 family natural product biosynthesis protein [Mycolicibacterium sp. 050232]